MDSDDYKKYTILEGILQNINRNYVALPKDETQRNNKLLQVIDRIIQTMRNKSPLFSNLFQNKFYGGSFYDGLKVGKPSEYDLDCVLCLPKIVQPTVEVSDKPGYVHVVLKNMEELKKSLSEAGKYVGLEKLLDGDRLSTQKVRSWMESLMTYAMTENNTAEIKLDDEDTKCIVKYKMVKSGPAVTLKLEYDLEGQHFKLDVDLVPCFTFFTDQWPKKNYRPNPSKTKNTFFVVPKSPSANEPLYWRLSFQEQERELMSGYANLKPTIKLIKKIRDRYVHKIASYFIKTVFLWELETVDKNLWKKPLIFVFVTMLQKYGEYIEKRNIPYYWNGCNNLIADLSEVTATQIANKIKCIVEHIERICNTKSNIYDMVPYFMKNDDFDIDAFKAEVPISKKLVKLADVIQAQPESQPQPTAILRSSAAVVPTSSAASSSAGSSFEEIPHAVHDEPLKAAFSPALFKMLERIEIQLVANSLEQKRILGVLETLVDKVERCEMQVKELKMEMNKKALEDTVQMDGLVDMVKDLRKKVDGVKKDELTSVDFLGLTRRTNNSLNFQPPF